MGKENGIKSSGLARRRLNFVEVQRTFKDNNVHFFREVK